MLEMNKEQGQAGASELLINPWARTSGWAGANVAGVEELKECIRMLQV